MPVPGELRQGTEVLARLRRIGRYGRPLCDRPAGSTGADASLDDFLAEARLFFDVLREDYPAALASLDALEPRLDSGDWRQRLLSLRAQIYLATGDLDRARETIAFLRAREGRAPRRWETTPAGIVLTTDPAAGSGFSGYLSQRLDDRVKAATGRARKPESRREPIELDAPLFGNRFVPEPPGMPPFRDLQPIIEPAPDDRDVRVRFRPRPPVLPPIPPMPPR
jgi:hypothetical protein